MDNETVNISPQDILNAQQQKDLLSMNVLFLKRVLVRRYRRNRHKFQKVWNRMERQKRRNDWVAQEIDYSLATK